MAKRTIKAPSGKSERNILSGTPIVREIPKQEAPPPRPVVAAPPPPRPSQAPSAPLSTPPAAPQVFTAPPPPPQQVAPAVPETPAPAPVPSAPPLLFECAWEVCWQLGGIYTVLRSKSAAMQRRWDDRYCLIGPYNPATAAIEFEERPTEGFIRQTLDRLRDAGMPCHYGNWLVAGRPRVILLDYRARYQHLDADKYLMWKDHGISLPAGDGEINEVVAFGFAVTEFFRNLCDVLKGSRAILAHFHEWMGGVAVPRIAHLRYPVTTVFTTHATLLGRYLANDNPAFYDHLGMLNPDAEAVKFNIHPRFAIERAAAHASTVFTTVSEVTAIEAEKLLGRKPDGVLPNGLNIHRFSAIHEFQNLHRQYKERINEFVMGHFFPSYTFDLDRTLYFFTSGRYEYRNKGYDLYIEALYRLNQRLKQIPDRPTIVAFIVTRAPVRNINVGVLQSQSMFEDLKSITGEIEHEMGKVLLSAAATGRMPSYQELLTQDASVRLKRAIHAWRSIYQPTIVTHDLVDDSTDAVIRHLRHRHLFNAVDDPVKVIFHPEFMSATSPLLSLDYEQFVRGCHMGIFPSYYEPWGYTPMESIALGVPAVTSDVSGFGAYVQRHLPDNEQQGILVLKRHGRSFDACADDLADYLFNFSQYSRRQRIELRNRVERLGEMFDWSTLVQHYHDAHQLALERTGAAKPGKIDIRLI
jgi:glycogen(starch) synthase